jgi:hypothetical protein
VIILHPTPRLGFEPKACFARPLKDATPDCSFSLAERERLNLDFEPLRQAIASSNPNVLFFDQNQVYCDVGRCSPIMNGMPLYRDQNHLSEYGSKVVYERFVKWARSSVPEILAPN